MIRMSFGTVISYLCGCTWILTVLKIKQQEVEVVYSSNIIYNIHVY